MVQPSRCGCLSGILCGDLADTVRNACDTAVGTLPAAEVAILQRSGAGGPPKKFASEVDTLSLVVAFL